MTKYYLVGYAYSKGFGNIFYEASPYLDIKAAEKEIPKITGNKGAVILTIVEIEKGQYVKRNPTPSEESKQ